ncbi:MAG TPA: nucleoside hydrolase [Amaricoccus sp.]|nr:nucleoside hydrolase [Amaricoccus sp.]
MTHRIIIDSDPGQDDAVAILLAFASPEIEVLGITSVAGNVPLELTTKNALSIVELAGREEVPVHAGAAAPLVRPLVTAESVHGKTGLDGPDLPEPRITARKGHAVDFIVETLRREPPGTVTLCVLGPMTNIAMAFARAPEIVGRVASLVAMGGAWSEGGNTTPAAEFNIHVDPHAAHAVFRSGVPIVLHPLDVTHKTLTRAHRVEAFRRLGTRAGTAVADMLDFFERFDEQKYGTDGGPLHDPNVIAWLISPGIYAGREVNVEVETCSELTMGQTVIDWWGTTGRPRNATVIREVDDDAFFALLLERIGRL